MNLYDYVLENIENNLNIIIKEHVKPIMSEKKEKVKLIFPLAF